ncbi:beta strand repeat-containing protein [Leptolyngbya ohadii]|uniref:beta strand repeat-containing protein n=1 Tax=Leptolyngbya ohadii TaxID=1962290 RepID=UPI000B59B2E2|nr:S-layer family protein [Leptolyngbya ohadii]
MSRLPLLYRQLLFVQTVFGSMAVTLCPCYPATAEIVSDATLPQNSRVDRQRNLRIIEGGTQRERNLFHSFREFSVPSNETAFFNNGSAIDNIFVRVTGENRSLIDGKIQANGTANLFLLNPNGILFGRNASLNIGGSFLATTGNSISFADGTEFSAANPQSSPLLTVSTPVGLQFGANPQPITNRSRFPTNITFPVGLQVATAQTLALIGGQIRFEGGAVTAASGRVELGAVGASSSGSQVSLLLSDEGFSLGYENVQTFRDVRLRDRATVNAGEEGGRGIQIYGSTIALSGQSLILSDTQGRESGGTISINAARSVILRDGSNIATFTNGVGRAGNVFINAADSIQIFGTAPSNRAERPSPSTIGSQVGGLGEENLDAITGRGGNVTLNTNTLTIENGGAIEASTFARGTAGNITIRAASAIELSGVSVFGSGVRGEQPSGIFAQVALGAIDNAGDAGNITIQTGDLTLLEGAQISSAARTGGQGGSIRISANNSVRLSGRSPNATPVIGRSGIFVSAERSAVRDAGQLNIRTRQLTVENGGEISANNFGPGVGGTITLDLDRLTVRSGGDIRASSNFDRDLGAAGNLIVRAREVLLDDGRLTVETGAREGANIVFRNLELLSLLNQSLISAQAFNDANGGNVRIDAPNGFVVASLAENSDIFAKAVLGEGGRIDITAINVLGLEERIATPLTNDIDASSDFGIDGQVILNTPDVDPSRGTAELPIEIVDASQLIGANCLTTGSIARTRGEFTITGRSGLPASPIDPLRTEGAISQWIELELFGERSDNLPEDLPGDLPVNLPGDLPVNQNSPLSAQNLESDRILEAQGWIVGAQGEIMLVAEAPVATPVPDARIACGGNGVGVVEGQKE